MKKLKYISKNCIFCGCIPKNKSKEHVIPKWLISLTGDLTRKIIIGYNHKELLEKDKLSLMSYSFNTFVAPACSKCNQEYSKLENETKEIIEGIINNKGIDLKDANTLLNWFDKIRVGLWLQYSSLNNNNYNVIPNYYINDRIETKDRLLKIIKINDSKKGLNMIGVNTPIFLYYPTMFGLRINNLIFINISSDFFLTKELGYSYPANFEAFKKGFKYTIQEGTRKLSLKPYKTFAEHNSLNYNGITLYQSILDDQFLSLIKKTQDLKYWHQNKIEGETNQGSIFIERNNEVSKFNPHTGEKLTPVKTNDTNKVIDEIKCLFPLLQLHHFQEHNSYTNVLEKIRIISNQFEFINKINELSQ